MTFSDLVFFQSHRESALISAVLIISVLPYWTWHYVITIVIMIMLTYRDFVFFQSHTGFARFKVGGTYEALLCEWFGKAHHFVNVRAQRYRCKSYNESDFTIVPSAIHADDLVTYKTVRYCARKSCWRGCGGLESFDACSRSFLHLHSAQMVQCVRGLFIGPHIGYEDTHMLTVKLCMVNRPNFTRRGLPYSYTGWVYLPMPLWLSCMSKTHSIFLEATLHWTRVMFPSDQVWT